MIPIRLDFLLHILGGAGPAEQTRRTTQRWRWSEIPWEVSWAPIGMGDDARISLPRRLQNVYHGNNFLTIFFTNSNLLCTCPGIQIPSRPVAVPKHTDNALIDFTHAFQITDVSSHLKCSAWHFFSQLKRMYVYLATIGMGRVISGPRTRRPLPHNDPNPLAVKLPKAVTIKVGMGMEPRGNRDERPSQTPSYRRTPFTNNWPQPHYFFWTISNYCDQPARRPRPQPHVIYSEAGPSETRTDHTKAQPEVPLNCN